MGFTIAVTGKGGTGKTTLSALMISSLVRQGRGPVLAVDADPNSCLDAAMGVRVRATVGSVREEAKAIVSGAATGGMGKRELLELKIAEGLVEADGFDLIAMGRPEGPGCYCYANGVLREVISSLSHAYPYTLIDNEAGLENLSRRIVASVDLLVLATDPSQNGMATVRRLHALAREMDVSYKRLAVVVNRAANETVRGAREAREDIGADDLLVLPSSAGIARRAEAGEPLSDMPADDPVMKIVMDYIRMITTEKTHG